MTDYGHPLRFGTFVTPSAQDPEATVGLARVAEDAGYDLVTFQDHPYQPRFLDTWTLLSYVASATERIHVAPDVVNVPMRPPAVLARAAASLDLLSDGRVELALGAGAFWDAMEAMGARRLTPGESVDALAEAIEVARAIWGEDGDGELFVPGQHHRLDGATPGPGTTRRIPLWLGALGPRMLRLVGEKADGWLPSLGRVGLDGLRAGNARIDEAAAAVGRDPREVTRLLNVSGMFDAVPETSGLGAPRPLRAARGLGRAAPAARPRRGRLHADPRDRRRAHHPPVRGRGRARPARRRRRRARGAGHRHVARRAARRAGRAS